VLIFYIPAAKETDVKEGGGKAQTAKGVKFLKYQDGNAVYSVVSGPYAFVSTK
jgi:alpha-L-rhamnosidase